MVIAEVYEGDIHHVKVNQLSKVKSENNTVPRELQKTIQEIGLRINKKYF
ncbi:MAG: hypothetical protein JJP05_07470 [cyanobacterium endosymbiont of Rhopalodia gibba]|jgi:hypothetical protein